jgi:MFS family permease
MSLCVLSLPYLPIFGLVALVSALMYLSLVSAEAPYLALLPDTVPPEQRSTASGVLNLLGSIGLITYYALGTALWDAHRTGVFFIVSLLPLALMLVTIAGTTEPDVAQEAPASAGNPLSYLRSFAEETNALRFFVGQAFWWLALWLFSSFLTLFMVEELGVSEGRSMLASMLFSVVSIVFMLPLGVLGDRVGRKGLLTVMLGFWVVVYLLLGLSQTVTQALIFAGLAGIPFAAARGVAYAYMLDLIPEERTAEFVGFNYLSQTLSLAVGAVMAGMLIDSFGYRSTFVAAALFTLVGVVMLQFVRPRAT